MSCEESIKQKKVPSNYYVHVLWNTQGIFKFSETKSGLANEYAITAEMVNKLGTMFVGSSCKMQDA